MIDELNTNNRHPPLGILIYGLVIIALGIFLLTIGSGIRVFLIIIVIGLSLIGLWLYLDIRKEKQKKGYMLIPHRHVYVQSVNIKKRRFVCNKNVHVVL